MRTDTGPRKKVGRTIGAVLLSALACVNLWGCEMAQQMQEMFPEEEETPAITTLRADKDGSITETIVDVLDESYYDSAELQKLVEESVKSYNARSGEQDVTTDRYEAEEGRIVLTMTYADPKAYAGFNNVPFFNGPILDAQISGYLFLNDFRVVDKTGAQDKPISSAEPLSHKEYQVLVTDLSHAVSVPGKVRYVSANANVVDGLVIPATVEEVKEEGLLLPSSAVYVKEKDQSHVSEEELEKTYMYVIYDM